jgi:molybdopterin synthase sulfur carrier subunit
MPISSDFVTVYCITEVFTMSIKVRYFASLKDAIGRNEDLLPWVQPLSVRQVWLVLNPEQTMPDSLLAAINMEYVDLDTQVADGAELAFFPPVTGG